MHKRITLLFLSGLLMLSSLVHGQALPAARTYAMLIKGGHVIDAKNKINEVMDVAIQNGKIAAVAKNIDPGLASQVVNATGMYVTPGLIDLHAHVFAGTEPDHAYSNGSSALPPDGFTFRAGVTTVVDCGGAGWKSFPTFKKNIIDQSRTRVLSFLNIVGEGMRGEAVYEQNVNDMDPKKAAETALANKEHIVGFKLAHFHDSSWVPVERLLQAGKTANMPVIVDFGGHDSHAPLSIEKLFTQYLRPGDIYTHVYTELKRRDPVVDLKTRQLRPFALPAQKKGIIFDVGFGGGSFNFNQAIPSIKAGFLPNTMGTDLHIGSMNGAMKDQLNVLSIFLAMGMDIPGVIARSTWAPAQAIKREELGNLSVGAIADVAVISVRKGKFGFRDIEGNRQDGTQKLECELTVKGGRVVYDLNAIVGAPSR
ncbi:amidohydrolase/deacetylase family metallohydrolase [Daejeonella lutea]|uniref:Dihydroorotase n=1 Tax=Daejeonella lutea TaxID=572036 RepID=A0A1T5ABP5_9SPHI|nr:amidohydrolase/deacetylase family metallohydrolase [Daejeonella lutea]SKB32378.1 dihydroorotase [Daejeonella lutea]